jgi:hypothetical protein
VARVFPAKPEGFIPKPALYLFLLVSNFVATFLIPYASNTPSFMIVSSISRALPFSFLALPYIIPETWGNVHRHPHDTHATYTTLFRSISTISSLLHVKSSFFALFHNTPESTYYRHSLLHPFEEEHRSALNRGSTALSRIFGAVLEHPAISAFGSGRCWGRTISCSGQSCEILLRQYPSPPGTICIEQLLTLPLLRCSSVRT